MASEQLRQEVGINDQNSRKDLKKGLDDQEDIKRPSNDHSSPPNQIGTKGSKEDQRNPKDKKRPTNDFFSTKHRSWNPREPKRQAFKPTRSPYPKQSAKQIKCGPDVHLDLFRCEDDPQNCWKAHPLVYGGLIWRDIDGQIRFGPSHRPSGGDWWDRATLTTLLNAKDGFLTRWKKSVISYLDCHPEVQDWARLRSLWKSQGWFDHRDESASELCQQVAFIPANSTGYRSDGFRPDPRSVAIKFVEYVVCLGLRLGGEALQDAEFFLQAVASNPFLKRQDEAARALELGRWEEQLKAWKQSLRSGNKKLLIRNAPESQFTTALVGREYTLDAWKQQPYGIELTALLVTGFPAVGKSHFMFELTRKVAGQFKNGGVWVALDVHGENVAFEEQLANALEFPPDARRDLETLTAYLDKESTLVILDQLDAASGHQVSSALQMVSRLKQSRSRSGFILGAGNAVRVLLEDVPTCRLQPLDPDASHTVFLQYLKQLPQVTSAISEQEACAMALDHCEGLPGIIKEFARAYSTDQLDSAIQAYSGAKNFTGGVSVLLARLREMFMDSEDSSSEVFLAQRIASLFEGLFDEEALVDVLKGYGAPSAEALPGLLVKHSRLIRRGDGLLYLPLVARRLVVENISEDEQRHIRRAIAQHYAGRSSRSRAVFGQENHLLVKQIGNLQLMWEEVLASPQEYSALLVSIAEVALDHSRFSYAHRLLGECQKIAFSDGVNPIKALLLLARVYRIERNFDAAQEVCDQAQALLDQQRQPLDPQTKLILQTLIASERAEQFFITAPFSDRNGQNSTLLGSHIASLTGLLSGFAEPSQLSSQSLLAKAKATRVLGKLHLGSNLARARSLLEEASSAFDTLAHWSELGSTLNDLGNTHLLDDSAGNVDQAAALFQRALRLFAGLGSNLYQRPYARSVGCLGNTALKRQDLLEARRYFEQCLSLLGPYGTTADLINTHLNLGWVHILSRRWQAASAHMAEVLKRPTTDELTKNALSACACIALQSKHAEVGNEIAASVPVSDLDRVFKPFFLGFFPHISQESRGSENWAERVPGALTMLRELG
jgi:tetratricopeptide (TPR) repeat protein